MVAYSLRAHRTKIIRGSDGARRNEVVGELNGEAELLGLQRQQLKQTIVVRDKPTQIVVNARRQDDF